MENDKDTVKFGFDIFGSESDNDYKFDSGFIYDSVQEALFAGIKALENVPDDGREYTMQPYNNAGAWRSQYYFEEYEVVKDNNKYRFSNDRIKDLLYPLLGVKNAVNEEEEKAWWDWTKGDGPFILGYLDIDEWYWTYGDKTYDDPYEAWINACREIKTLDNGTAICVLKAAQRGDLSKRFIIIKDEDTGKIKTGEAAFKAELFGLKENRSIKITESDIKSMVKSCVKTLLKEGKK